MYCRLFVFSTFEFLHNHLQSCSEPFTLKVNALLSTHIVGAEDGVFDGAFEGEVVGANGAAEGEGEGLMLRVGVEDGLLVGLNEGSAEG